MTSISATVEADTSIITIETDEETIATSHVHNANTRDWDRIITRMGFRRTGDWAFRGGDGEPFRPGMIGEEDGPESADAEVERIPAIGA